MASIFSPDEIVNAGIRVELNGRIFYQAAAAAAGDRRVGDLFALLAREEDAHAAAFRSILGTIPAEPYEPPAGMEEEYARYIAELADTHVFTRDGEGARAAERAGTARAALDMALQFEKDSIVFYSEMKRLVRPGMHGPIDLLIEQERGHVARIMDLRHSLEAQPDGSRR